MPWRKVQLFVLENLMWFIAGGVYIIFTFLVPHLFFNLSNINYILHKQASVGVIAIGEGIILLSGSMDLSLPAIGGVGGVCLVMTSNVWFPGAPTILLLLLPLIVGAACGALNGFYISRTGVHPFLVTLGTLLLFTGLKEIISLKTYLIQNDMVKTLGGGSVIQGLSFATILVLLVAFLIWVFLNQTHIGMRIYGIGGNAASAELTGVNVKNNRLLVHVLGGVLGGLGGLLWVGRQGAYYPSMLGFNTIFMVFAMAVFGGISLRGGRGNIEDVVAGIFFIGTLFTGLSFLDVGVYLRYAIVGSFIIAGVIINSARFEIRDRLLTSA